MKLFLLVCFTGLIPGTAPILSNFPLKYELIMTPMSWADAQNYCRMNHIEFATILSDTDRMRFNKEAESKGLTSPAWVGLYNDIDSWRWSLNNLPLKNAPYTNWYLGEPNNNGGNRECGMIGALNEWWDNPCHYQLAFICYNANFSDADKFIGVTGPLSWPEALTYCRTHHTDLAIALSSSDNDTLVQIKIGQGNSWIGLYRDSWKWSGGTNVSALKWASGEPDNSGQICAVVYNGLFSDEACTDRHYFVCHTISPIRAQIIRMEVQSDGTGGAVYHPSVQLSMLEKIKKKLEEKGVVNVTVTWRVQPNGNIFHKKKKN